MITFNLTRFLIDFTRTSESIGLFKLVCVRCTQSVKWGDFCSPNWLTYQQMAWNLISPLRKAWKSFNVNSFIVKFFFRANRPDLFLHWSWMKLYWSAWEKGHGCINASRLEDVALKVISGCSFLLFNTDGNYWLVAFKRCKIYSCIMPLKWRVFLRLHLLLMFACYYCWFWFRIREQSLVSAYYDRRF